MTWWQGALALYMLGAAVTWLVLIARLARDRSARAHEVSTAAMAMATIWPLTWAIVGAILLGEAVVFRLRRRVVAEEGEGES